MSLTPESFFQDLYSSYKDLMHIEFRCLGDKSPNSPQDRLVRFVSTVEQALGYVQDNAEDLADAGYSLYFGVLPRTRTFSATKKAIRSGTVVWVDIDAKDTGSKEACWKAIDPGYTGIPLPSYIIDSGNGLHGYWLLDHELYDLEALEAINKGLAHVIGGDHCHNRDRILRAPGSFNVKHERRLSVDVVQASKIRYPLRTFGRYLAIGESLRLETQDIQFNPECPAETKMGYLPVWITELLREGSESKWALRYSRQDESGDVTVDKSRMDFYVVCKLLEEGFSPDEIAGIFTDPNYGISEKTLRSGKSYLRNTINRAVAKVEKNQQESVCES